MLSRRRRYRQLRRAMRLAQSYEEWRESAEALDVLQHRQDWIEDDQSDWFDASKVRKTIDDFRRCRREGEPLQLMPLLEEAISRHYNDVINPRLYGETYSGENKTIARSFLQEAVASLRYLAEYEHPAYDDSGKLALFQAAYHKYGRSALMLSGGATLGIHHFGVVKTLFEHQMLPQVIAGSSMGAIIAAGICTRSDDELEYFFHRPEAIQRMAMKLKKPKRIFSEFSLFDPEILLRHIRANMGEELTFAEAFAKTGRLLNISVSPTRRRQKPRILSHSSSPDLLISQSALASCSMPLLYPPAMLWARGDDAKDVPYQPDERWIDGSVSGDLPMGRVSRLHNVNHFIVSQTNPHVYLFVGRSEKPSFASMGLEMGMSMAQAQIRSALGSARKMSQGSALGPVFDQLHSLSDQPYLGDINIHPKSDPWLLRKILSNPSRADIEMFIREGERATWPKMAMIRDQTLLSRSFAKIIQELREKSKKKSKNK